ncbi:MAG TPA: VWA domain-containing protein [Thermoanaerobaculia bacterium]|nr:VWA domain-containing protein [Thermoanaerobaculia bacterium]
MRYRVALFAAALAASLGTCLNSSGQTAGDSAEPSTDRPYVRLVSPFSSDSPVGETRIEAAVTGYRAGDELTVFADGRRIGRVAGPPWSIAWNAGATLQPHEVTVALVRGGREIATAHVRTRSVGFSSSAKADVVSVAPIVTDRMGRYVPGLTAKNFTVLDDGVPRRIETFDATDSPLSAVLVLDVSGSMLYKIEEARRSAHAFVDALKPEDEVALLTFNSTTVGWVPFTRQRDAIHSEIDASRTEGETALYDAAGQALKRLKPLKRRKAVVLFTDGEDNRSRLSVDQVVGIARASEVSIYAVAQGLDERTTLRAFLDQIADQTGGRSYFIGSIEKLSETFRKILKELKSQYYLTYTPRPGLRPRTWHRIEIKVDRPDVVVRARKEYFFQ